jgi:hypothetical protein
MRDVWYLVKNPDESLCLAKGQEDVELVPRSFEREYIWYFDKNAWEYTKMLAVIHFLSMFAFLNDVIQVVSFVLSVIVVCTDNNKYTLPCVFGHLLFCATNIPLNIIYWSLYSVCISCMYTLGYSILLTFYLRLDQ